MPITVLLTNTNWWPCSAHLAIALARAGCRVAAAYPQHGHPLAKTKAVSRRFRYQAVSPLPALRKAIEDSSPDLIVPCDDRAARHLHLLHSRALAKGSSKSPLADLIERSLGSPAAFSVVSSRSALLRAAQEEQIRTPDLSAVSNPEDLRCWSVTQPFPWVMKADHSWGGHGVKIVHSLKEAEACFHRMSEPLGTLAMLKRTFVNRDPFWIESWWCAERPGITVQSYVEGYPANCTVFCWKGKVLAGISVQVVTAQSVTGPATIVRIVDEPHMLGAAQALAHRLTLSGFHGFDFMMEARTKTAYLIELNPRCTMPCHLRLGQGRDLIGALHVQLSGCPSSQAPSEIGTNLVAYFPQAWLSDPHSEVLRTGFHDVPWGEPELLKELMLLPWPDRSLFARISDQFRNARFEQRSARRFVFQPGPSSEDVDWSANGVTSAANPPLAHIDRQSRSSSQI